LLNDDVAELRIEIEIL